MKAPTLSILPRRAYWEPPPQSQNRAEPATAAAHQVQIRACKDGATPRQVIALIEPLYDTANDRAKAELKAHIADLYAFGESWPLMFDKTRDAWIMPDGRSVPMSQPDYGRREWFT